MNSEKELINKLRALRTIKPDNDWAVSCKARILKDSGDQKISAIILIRDFVFRNRLAFVGMALMIISGGGLLAAAQSALPGEPLYGMKKNIEKGMVYVMGQSDSPAANLRLATKRLEEIDIISRKNLVQNLPAAFYEYKVARAEAKKEVAAMVKKSPERAGEIAKEAARTMRDIDEKERQVYAVVGEPLIGEESTRDVRAEVTSDKQIIESLIIHLNTEEMIPQERMADLNKVRALYSAGAYSEAIDYYLTSSLNQ